MSLSKSLRIALIPLALLACAASAHAQSRYTYSAAGGEVTNSQTGLVWRRCSEGQSWSGGTCTGTAATYTHEAALVQAQAQAGAAGWRLPNVKELSSITDKTRVSPAIDPTVFPATPASDFWTATPSAGDYRSGWFIRFNYGGIYLAYRDDSGHVRLVR
jgi:hypothetical protein